LNLQKDILVLYIAQGNVYLPDSVAGNRDIPTYMKPPPSKASRAWEALTPELSEWILNAASSMGFERMTPVQASTIPLFMGNKDVVVEV
jgi:superfamily II DNA/RNA helicase